MDKVEKCMCWTRHGKTLPRFYYIAGDENEQRSLACAQRVANDELFLWGQSLYLVAMMLGEQNRDSVKIPPGQNGQNG